MKTIAVIIGAVIATAGFSKAYAAGETVTMNAIGANGVGTKIGTIHLSDTGQGLRIEPRLAGLPPGSHGFHIHVNPNCGPGKGPDGQTGAGLAAGGHYDPANTGKHLGPLGDGHKGDLPAIAVDAGGKADQPVVAPHVKVSDVKGRSVMIHLGGDNYSDQPTPLGGGGARIACGVAK